MKDFFRSKPILTLVALVLLVTVLASSFIGLGSSAAHAKTSAWYDSDRPISQRYGCTTWTAEPVDNRFNCHGIASDHQNHVHEGVDLLYPTDCYTTNYNVYAGMSGTVHVLHDRYGYGANYPVIALDSSHYVVLGHVKQILMRDGQQVTAGTLVAYIGNEGASTQCHLHFEVDRALGQHTTSIDPTPYLNPAPSPSGSHPSAIEKSNGDVNVFYPAADGTLHMAYWNSPGTSGWHDYSTGRPMTGSPSAVEVTTGNRWNTAGTVCAYYADARDGNLHELSWNPGKPGSWPPYWSDHNTGRWITGSPSAVVDHSGVVHVFYSDRGTSPPSLEEYYLDGSGWHYNDFGRQYRIAGDPYAMVKQHGEVNVFYHNANDNDLHMVYRNASGDSWVDYNTGQAITNSPTAVEATISTPKNAAGTVRIYYSGNDAHHSMNELSWNPGNGSPYWNVHNTGRWMQNSASAIRDHAGTVHVYYNDPGPNPAVLQQYYLDSAGWHTSAGSCVVCGNRWLVGSPFALIKRNGDVNVFYRDSGDGQLHMSYLPSGGNWNDVGFYPMAP